MKISGRIVSTRPISLSRAAKLISRFAAVENGSSPAVSLYLQRTSDAFNNLVQFHSKAKNRDSENIVVEKSELNDLEETKKKKKKRRNDEAKKRGSKKSRVDS